MWSKNKFVNRKFLMEELYQQQQQQAEQRTVDVSVSVSLPHQGLMLDLKHHLSHF